MKKLFFATVIMLLITFSGCSASKPTATDSSSETKTTKEAIKYEPETLITMYCNDTWNGEFISQAFNCASIENGYLWIDCENKWRIPDMGLYEDPFCIEVISYSAEEGTWIYDQEVGTIELWKKGTRYKKIDCNTSYYSTIYKISDGFIAHNGSNIVIYNTNGLFITSFKDVIDCYQDSENKVFISTFEHKNFAIHSTEKIVEIETSYVHFPREQITLDQNLDSETVKIVIGFFKENPDTDQLKINDNFAVVDYDGNIIVNNQFAGNVCIGSELVPSSPYGANIYLDAENSYWLNGSELVKFNHGSQTTIDIPDGDAEFLWVDEHNGFLIKTYDNQIIFVGADDTVETISTKAVDANVAYDTLYYMEGNTVYSLLWTEEGATPKIFFEGAYGVSPHSDESEGALVPYEEANYNAYGYSNIYSPYGK